MQYIKSLISILNHPNNSDKKIKTLLRLLFWKVNQIFFHVPAIIELTQDRKCICYTDSSNGGLVVYSKLFDYSEMTYLLKKLKPEDTFIDVGANIGVYTLLASSVITKGMIHAFEPYGQSQKRLLENLRLNDIANVQVVEKIVSDKTGYEYLGIEKESEINHIIYSHDDKKIKISSITLDDYIFRNKINKISILKIDVEGAEMKVLKGGEESIRKGKIKKILLELNRNNQFFGTSNRAIIDWLKLRGYRISLFTEHGKQQIIKSNNIDNNQILNIIAVYRET
ncbi:MAG: FkbM family methyltransferase [Patescibacteria group bacterium]